MKNETNKYLPLTSLLILFLLFKSTHGISFTIAPSTINRDIINKTTSTNGLEVRTLLSRSIFNQSKSASCKNHCSFHGYCSEGICYCKPGYTGDDCGIDTKFNTEFNQTEISCFNNCSGNGICEEGQCNCNKDYGGVDCSLRINCKNNCNHGECLNGQCVCYQYYTGEDCSISLKKCKNNCNNQGRCIDGQCKCLDGFLGDDCSTKKLDCSNRGIYSETNNTCNCYSGFHGSNCESAKCPDDCHNNGKCLSNGLCLCNNGYTGFNCGESINFLK